MKADPELGTKLAGILKKSLWNEDYYNDDTLRMSDNIQIQGSMNGHLVGMMVLSYIMTFLCTFNGLKSTGKFVWVSCLSPYVILGILLVKGATLEGSGKGLGYLFIPTAEKWALVGAGSTWKSAATQILFSSGVAYGPFLYYGSARGKSD